MAEIQTRKRRIAPATIALILAALVAIVAVVIAATRSGEVADETAEAPQAGAPAGPPSIEQSIASIRQRLDQDPDNHEGWYLLGLAYKDTGRFTEARQAFQRAMQLQPNNPDYLAGLGEAILVTGGEHAPQEAEPLFRRALEFDEDHAASRYYLATLTDLKGDHRQAVDELIVLLREAPAGAAWAPGVRRTIEEIAQRNEIDIEGRLPPMPAAPPPSAATAAIPGPTREQMEAARNIPPSEQDEMVKGMVDRLDQRLRANPRDERGWMMLMRSRMVQNEPQRAAEALRSGLAAFADDPAAQQRLRTAAAELGIPAG